jgi:tetratricopeptide (TPR) repeat protein
MVSFRNLCHTLRCVVFCFLIAATAALTTGAQRPASDAAQPSAKAATASDELNEGVAAYRNAHYDEAIAHFQRAADLDPGMLTAKIYLGTALAQNVVPGLDTPENLKTAQQAIDVIEQVLEKDPHNVNCMKQVAGIYFDVKKLDDAKEWQKKVLDEDPSDAEAAYTIGVIDWEKAHRNALVELQKAGFNDDGQGNTNAPKEVLEAIKAQNAALVAEALEYLSEAVQIRSNYDDAMQYLNLVYRRKADVDWDNRAARDDDMAKAQEWARKAMAARKANQAQRMAAPPDSAQP